MHSHRKLESVIVIALAGTLAGAQQSLMPVDFPLLEGATENRPANGLDAVRPVGTVAKFLEDSGLFRSLDDADRGPGSESLAEPVPEPPLLAGFGFVGVWLGGRAVRYRRARPQ